MIKAGDWQAGKTSSSALTEKAKVVISTYGTPKLGQYVSDLRDDYLDSLPIDLHECSSVERIIPTAADAAGNWHEIANGSPGEVPYQ